MAASRLETIVAAWRAGADTFVAGTAVFGQPDIAAAVRALKKCLHGEGVIEWTSNGCRWSRCWSALVLGGFALVWFGPDQAVAVGAKAPNYKALDLRTGDSLALRSHYEGHVTLVNIWATWCVPCKVEMPAMQRLYDSLGARGFRIAAVSIDQQGPEVVRAFANDFKLTFDILQDRSGKIQQAYQTTGVPESFLLDNRASS